MPNLSIKNVPENVVEKLRQRASSNHRSLQGELLDLVCRSIETDGIRAEQDRISSGWMSIDEVAEELRASQRKPSARVPLAVNIIRQDRDSR